MGQRAKPEDWVATIDDLRKQMQFPAGHVMLNAGSLSPVPMPVFLRAQAIRLEQATNAHEFFFTTADEYLAVARGALAEFIEGDAGRLVLLPNVTWAINVAFASLASSLNEQGGGRPVVLTTDLEYGSLQFALEQFADRFEREVVTIVESRSWDEIVERFAARLDELGPRVAAVYLSHVTSGLGWELPVERVCRLAKARGVTTIVDGAHGPGAVPVGRALLNVCDAYGGNCHKWMMAPTGAGFLHVSEAFRPHLRPLVMSWGAKNRSLRGEGETLASIENHGCTDRVAQMVIPEAIAFWKQVRDAGGPAHVEALRRYLVERLAELREQMKTRWLEFRPSPGESAATPMAAFTFPPVGRKPFRDAMLRRNIACVVTRYREDEEVDDGEADGRYDFYVRACTSWFNTRVDIDRLVAAIPDVMGEMELE